MSKLGRTVFQPITDNDKQTLHNFLVSGITRVVFRTVTGDKLRTMFCTTCRDLVPSEDTTQDFEESVERKIQGRSENRDIRPAAYVYDLQKKAWRSFRYDKVIEFDIDDHVPKLEEDA